MSFARFATALCLLGLAFAGCYVDVKPAEPTAPSAANTPYSLDHVLRFNEIQAKGTHNSYHVETQDSVHGSHRYTHAPLRTQLAEHGVRQFELDVHLNVGGDFQVFHLPWVDAGTTCALLSDCLQEIRSWSDENPWHLPLLVWLEPKDVELDAFEAGLTSIVGHYDALESTILGVWPRQRILTPDDVRKDAASLPEALRKHGWPTLGELRGRVVFALLDREWHRTNYLGDQPNLKDKLLFVLSDTPSDPFAALFKVNNCIGEGPRAEALVRSGFIVTSNVDDVERDDAYNRSRLALSIGAGAHYLSSDYPAPVAGRKYWLDLEFGRPAQCNAVSASRRCTPRELENLTASRKLRGD